METTEKIIEKAYQVKGTIQSFSIPKNNRIKLRSYSWNERMAHVVKQNIVRMFGLTIIAVHVPLRLPTLYQ